MIDERAFIAEVESASAERFAEILRTANMEQQRALQVHFGPQKFERLRLLAQQQVTRGVTAKKGRLVLLAGILGSEITVKTDKVWFSPWRIFNGQFDQLQVDASGKPANQSSATGMLRQYYGEIEQTLLLEWDVLSFPFDWRLDIRASADLLKSAIDQHFGSPNGVHLVAHSMGGLVSRCMAQRYTDEWAAMGKLIMMGTPNHGSLAITQLFTGMYRLIRVLAAIDVHHSLPELLQLCKMFPGTYQMLPRVEMLQQTANPEKVMDPATYGNLNPASVRFQDAKNFQKDVDEVLNPERMVYIAGSNQPTADGVTDWTKLSTADGYHMTSLGDGTVPHSLGLLKDVQTYYVVSEHSALPDNDQVITAVRQLLVGDPVSLPTVPPVTRGVDDVAALRQARQIEDDTAVAQARVLVTRFSTMRGANATVLAPEERQIADLAFVGQTEPLAAAAVAGVAGATAVSGAAAVGTAPVAGIATAAGMPSSDQSSPQAAPKLKLNICTCKIEDIGTDRGPATDPKVDAIAVGHYIGVMPVFAELALDQAISARVIAAAVRDNPPREESDKDALGLIAQFTQRGLVRGELGRPFFLPDPRDAERLIVVAGMGSVGRFGDAELTVLAREAFWSLAMLGKKHLASVLIGSGSGNLDYELALKAWLRGIAFAIANRPDTPRLEELTFIEQHADKAEDIRQAAIRLKPTILKLGLDVQVLPEDPIPQPTVPAIVTGPKKQDPKHRTAATRILIEKQDNVFRFSAMSENASWPERTLKVDPKIVQEANNSLAVQADSQAARDWGSFLFKFMVPQEVQSKLSGSAPIVLACDSNVAQIHWELMVAPDSAGASVSDGFLGLAPGITRQLRNNFEGIPEPPPPSRRTLRVLVVGDTCYENPLPGAAAEAAEVVKVFKDYQETLRASGSKMNIEVEQLIGPNNATCIQVLKRLLTQTYDILHYSGHCEYVKDDPPSSGWLFSGGLKLSANELTRVDRVPAFVFSNACESGVTPSRPDLRTPELAPSFAESFFQRGVKNFVCTAWPVQDNAAALFASQFYASLLGRDTGRPAYMNEAMGAARAAVEQQVTGVQGWAAYQHYGNPYFKMV